MKHTYSMHFAAHYNGSIVTVPDTVAKDQSGFAESGKSFPALRRNGSRVRVKVDGEATGIGTAGIGDLTVKAA